MSIRAHGGAVRYWRHKTTGMRSVLCQDGTLLYLTGGRWKAADYVANVPPHVDWEEDTRRVVTAAITRTNREARRQ